ncbi:MAG: hypothetical protein ACJ741_07160 [Pyrinomonadaceae bacterium]
MSDGGAGNWQGRARRLARDFTRRVELADAGLLLYVVASVRVYLWFVTSDALAWSATACAAALCWFFYVATRSEEGRATTKQFWLVVALPLVFVYLLRSAFPDYSFDVANYRLFNGERALHGVVYLPGDWFPTPGPFNPVPDIATGLTRHLLGYRLGTSINLLATVWAAQVVERLLRPAVRRDRVRAACVLFVVLSEYFLFEINEYMIDVLAVPLILEAIYLATRAREGRDPRGDFIRGAFLLGLTVNFKLTNLTAAVPVALLLTRNLFALPRPDAKRLAAAFVGGTVAAAAPLVPYAAYCYALTGNPLFPAYNAIFKSPYWGGGNFHDPRWGPVGLAETLLWPLLSAFEPSRISELNVYSGRIALGFVASLVALLFTRRDARLLRDLAFVFLLDALLWSWTTGYIRYALQLELLAGIICICLLAKLLGDGGVRARSLKLTLSAIVVVALAAQGALACYYVLRTEWGGRETFVKRPSAHLKESLYYFRDRSITKYLTAEQRARVADVGVWIGSGIKSSAPEIMLRPDLPVIGLREENFFATDEARAGFAAAVARAGGKNMRSLCLVDELPACREALARHGFTVTGESAFVLPYFSLHNLITFHLLEVAPRDGGANAGG